MQFTKLRKTKTYGNYQNISLEADFDHDEKVEWVSDVIDRKIDELIAIEQKKVSEYNRHRKLTSEISSLECKLNDLERTMIKYSDYMKKHGMDITDELPF